MEIRQLVTFRTVAEHLNFTRAAEVLNYAQSSVTAQIQTLEEELGVQLFERLGRRVRLTPEGQRLLAYSEKILKLVAETEAAVKGDEHPGGTLTIGAPETLCSYRLPPVLQRFRARFPGVQLVFRPGIFPVLRRALGEGSVDVAFFLEENAQAADLVMEPLLTEPMVLLGHPDHPLVHRVRVEAPDLDGETLLLTEAGCSYRRMFERALTEAGVHPASTLEFSSVEAIKQCVMADMGIALLPRIAVAAELAQGRLGVLPWCGVPFSEVTQMTWHKDKWLSPALRAFLEVTREVLAPPGQVAAAD